MAMKCVVLLAALSLAGAASSNPVSRVAQLLEGLASKIDAELAAEEDLYESYVCWSKKVISTKTASNQQAQSRADSLKTYIADISAGRIELTSERTDLEKEVKGLKKDLATAKALRGKENADYKAAAKEMSEGITSLSSAIKILHQATKKSKGSLVSLRSRLSQTALESESQGFGARVVEADELERAVNVGSRWLQQGDALFLRRLLSGEVPKHDWKKLNRKADFKMKYKARSVKIQDVLSKLKANFVAEKADAEKKEKDAQSIFEKLRKAKESQLKSSTTSQTKSAVENGAGAVAKGDAKSEIKALETQIKDDKKTIAETTTALANKKKEFVERKGLRVGEVKAINEAISVIHSDSARDLFKRRVSLLQVDNVVATALAQAASALRDTARSTGNLRLSALAMRVELTVGAKFDKVLRSIGKMLKALGTDGKKDQANKAECEKDRKADTKEAKDLSGTIDDLADGMSKLKGEIAQINKEVAEKQESLENLDKEIKSATELRGKENAEFKQSDADDVAAMALLQQSAKVLKTFYAKSFEFVQGKTVAFEDKAGPKTWKGDYGGAKKESNGIIGILGVIEADVKKDQVEANKAETTAQTQYEKFVSESQSSIQKFKTDINELNDARAKKQKDVKNKKTTTATKKGTLAVVMKRMADAAPGCDFLLSNFKVRANNRKLEMKGLSKAMKILKKQNK